MFFFFFEFFFEITLLGASVMGKQPRYHEMANEHLRSTTASLARGGIIVFPKETELKTASHIFQ